MREIAFVSCGTKADIFTGLIVVVFAMATFLANPLSAQEHGDHDPHAGHSMTAPVERGHNSRDDRGKSDAGNLRGATHGHMQGGSAPADARDPHAYSAGYTLTTGPYALSGQRQLQLMDEHNLYGFMFDRLEYSDRQGDNPLVYDTQAWYGRTYDRLVIKAEGELVDGTLEESRTELLWGHAIAAYWDSQLGLRHDSAEAGVDRTWLALGVQGLAPYWFEVDASVYLGDSGRSALRLETEYDLLLSQRLILQPRVELNLYGREDRDNGIGSGLSDVAAGLRLRYEFSRQLAPYIGVEWTQKYGNSADLARQRNSPVSDTRWVAGVRIWF